MIVLHATGLQCLSLLCVLYTSDGAPATAVGSDAEMLSARRSGENIRAVRESVLQHAAVIGTYTV